MTYGELMLKWIHRILIILLIISICGMGITAIVRAKAAARNSDAVISRADYLLAKYGR